MSTSCVRVLMLAVLGWFSMPEATAAKLILITRGDTISHLGSIQYPSDSAEGGGQAGKLPPIDPNILRNYQARGCEVGYAYSYVGLFWIDLWTSDGYYCVYTGDIPQRISDYHAAALLGETSPPSRPFFYKFPPGLLIVGGLVVYTVLFHLVTWLRTRNNPPEDQANPAGEEQAVDQSKPLDETRPHEG